MENFNTGTLNPEEPCLVDSGQGFSVYYKDRFLYSKHSPKKNIQKAIELVSIPEESVVLAISPCLWYGLAELAKKTPESSFIIGLEADEKLFSLAQNKLEEYLQQNPEHKTKILLATPETIEDVINKLPPQRKVINIEFSGGSFINKVLYTQIINYIQNYIASFWKNRVTLVKLGRLFNRNFFKNLKNIPAAKSIPLHSKYLDRPIIVFGAGESTEIFLKKADIHLLNKCIIIAVDAVFPVLQKYGLKVDFVTGVESQLAIEKAYIGVKYSKSILLSDMAGRNEVIRHFSPNTLYFYSEFDNSSFFSRFEKKDILPLKIPALGSVGLTATYLALMMRANENVNVYVCGLDFSFTLGKTHLRGAPAHVSRLISCSKIKKVENYEAAFKISSKKINGKNGKMFTDAALSGYGFLFNHYFKNTKNLFDAGEEGIPLNIEKIPVEHIYSACKNFPETKDFSKLIKSDSRSKTEITEKFLDEERQSILRIKELLSKGENSSPPPHPSLNEELYNLLKTREYLYLHYPDGYKCDISNISFLKRVRSELEFFLKDLE